MDGLLAQVDINELMLLLKQYGPLVLIVAFFLWQGWVRETRTTNRLSKLEDDQRKVILPLVEKCTRVIAKNTVVMRRLERAMDAHWTKPKPPKC